MSPEPTSKPWTCPCGRTVHGNGGRSSHQRICDVYHTVQRDSWGRNLDHFKAAGRPGHEVRNAQRMFDDHQAALDEILARQGGPEGDEPTTTAATGS